MDYKNRLKMRKVAGTIIALIGVTFIITAMFVENEMLSPFGVAFFVCGVARVIKLCRITRNEELFNKMEVAEKDERNIKIWTEARSLSFIIYMLSLAIAIIVLSFLQMHSLVNVLSWCLFGFVALYWVCYLFVSRKY